MKIFVPRDFLPKKLNERAIKGKSFFMKSVRRIGAGRSSFPVLTAECIKCGGIFGLGSRGEIFSSRAILDVMSRDVVLAPARNDTVPIQEVSVQTARH